MRLATIYQHGATRASVIQDGRVRLLPYADVGELLASGLPVGDAARSAGEDIDVAKVRFAPPVPRPEKIICVGLNFRAHAAEAGFALPNHPTLFAKYWRSLIGHGEEIDMPPNSDAVDWEAELGVVMGRSCRYATEQQALDAIAGYTVVNDISMRDWQLRTSQFLQGKTFELSTPVGPCLVTPDEVDHARNLVISCEVNGEEMQNCSTTDMIFSPAQIVAYISEIMTLVPGDLIACGTPSGVGGLQNPPRYLRSGDVVTTTVEGVGELSNRCSAVRKIATGAG
jgi:acylpyruvate hydrolase